MSGGRNTFDVCSRHANGHLNYCCVCQEEGLRDLLREVANCGAIQGDGPWAVLVPDALWAKLLPLRTPGEAKHE